ncbi:MAG: hypothetical protein HC902_02670 [Calothrix sp. SM1_5_4]|nr:hypothetical protein [Calothrix sp. SM1_5_4]
MRKYGEVARHAIISKVDLDQYEAIRVLSDMKEDPRSTAVEIAAAEERLTQVNGTIKDISEAGLLSRMNWWTAEYGLIGDLKSPKIFGAGLLSSVGESRQCLSSRVKKIPLSVNCVEYGYDITEPQPQLFVTSGFAQLGDVLEELALGLAYRRGGAFGLKRAKDAGTVNCARLNSGLEISGVLKDFLTTASDDPAYLIFEGPAQLAANYAELPGQGTARHPHGFVVPRWD